MVLNDVQPDEELLHRVLHQTFLGHPGIPYLLEEKPSGII